MSGSARGRPPIDKAARDREQRRAVLHKGMLACYEVIDMARKELAELDAAGAGKTIPATGVVEQTKENDRG